MAKFEYNQSPKPDGTLVFNSSMSSKFVFWRGWSRGKVVIFFTILFIVVVLVSSVIVATINYNVKSAQDKAMKKLQETSDSISSKIKNGDYSGAQKEIDSNSDFKNTSQGAIASASIKSSQGDEQGALNVLTDAEKANGLDISLADQIALAYEVAGNKAQAILYYQKELQLVQSASDYPVKNADIKYLTNHIESLK